jgi:hypothetical protein
LIRSVYIVITAFANVSSVFQLFSFLVVCSDMISKGFGIVTFFASVKASSVCIRLSCLACIQSVFHGVWSRLFCGHKGCSLKTGVFGNTEVSYHQTYSARDWLSILRTPYPTQNLQRKYSDELINIININL